MIKRVIKRVIKRGRAGSGVYGQGGLVRVTLDPHVFPRQFIGSDCPGLSHLSICYNNSVPSSSAVALSVPLLGSQGRTACL